MTAFAIKVTMKRMKNPSSSTLFSLLCLVLGLILCAGMTALGQGAALSASAVPDAWYEPFDSLVTVDVRNTGDTLLNVTGLMIEDVGIPNVDKALAPGETTRIEARIRISDKMLNAGHFYVTVYYTYTDENGLSIPSVNQTMTAVRRLEDKIISELRFALPDRPVDGEETVLVSYILENTGETDMVNTVLICYPEGYFSSPMTVPAGGHAVIKRLVSVEDLDKISAKVSAQSGYSGAEYTLEEAYEGNLIELATSAEEYEATLPPHPQDTQEEPNGREAQSPFPTEDVPPAIRAEARENDILIHVSAGSRTLKDVRVEANGESVRTLVLLKAGLEADIPYSPAPGSEESYIFTLSAVGDDGEEYTAASESLFFAAPATMDEEENETGSAKVLSALISAPRLTTFILIFCAAALLATVAVSASKATKKRAQTEAKAADKPKKHR